MINYYNDPILGYQWFGINTFNMRYKSITHTTGGMKKVRSGFYKYKSFPRKLMPSNKLQDVEI